MKWARPILALGLIALPATVSAQIAVDNNVAAKVCFWNADHSLKTDEAVRECDEALETEMTREDMVATLVNRGIVRMLRMEDSDAEFDFLRALKLDKSQPEAFLNMALLRLRQGEGPEAFQMAQMALDKKTAKPALALYARGIANEYLGRIRQAYADLQAAQAADPKWPLPAEELKRYEVVRK